MLRYFAKVLLVMFLLVPVAQAAGTTLTINIVGRPDTARMAADADLARRVATALAGDARLQGFALRVEVKHGVTMIAGRVFNDHERQLALQVVRAAVGSSDVENRIVALEDFMPTTLGRSGEQVIVGI